jgi:hypothetical protein
VERGERRAMKNIDEIFINASVFLYVCVINVRDIINAFVFLSI